MISKSLTDLFGITTRESAGCSHEKLIRCGDHGVCTRSEIGRKSSRDEPMSSADFPRAYPRSSLILPLISPYLIISSFPHPLNRRPVSGLQASTKLLHGARIPSLQISHLGIKTVIYKQMTFNSISLHRSGIMVRRAGPEMQETHTKI